MRKFQQVNSLFCKVAIVFSFILNPISSVVYRPWAYQNNFADFGIADSITSYLGCITLVFISIYIDEFNPKLKSILGITLGCLIYEIIQPFVNLGVYDPNDLIAVFLGTLTCLMFLWLNNQKNTISPR